MTPCGGAVLKDGVHGSAGANWARQVEPLARRWPRGLPCGARSVWNAGVRHDGVGRDMELVTPGAANLGLFAGAALALLLIPGPAVLYIVGRSVEHGRRAGLVSLGGIHAATLVHVAAAALGLSAVLASSAVAFGVVKYAGAAYLIWLGLRKIFGRGEGGAAASPGGGGGGHARLLRDGFVVNLLNPKTAIFFLAFLPQFVDPGRGHVAMQVAVLGLLFTALGFVTDGCYALAAGTAGNWLKRSRSYFAVERYVSGALFIGLGLSAAFAGNHNK
jgi:threonine/homoserine/homoserine lactone efflux protein